MKRSLYLSGLLVFLCFGLAAFPVDTGGSEVSDRVLVFTKTEGYRHGSISKGVALLKRLGRKNGFKIDRTEDASEFNPGNLKMYKLVIFLSTTGDVLNEEQQEAFEGYIRGGGSFMGIHAAADTEYGWPWYGELVGGYFESHPPTQNAKVRVATSDHPAVSALPDPWERRDEWYNYKDLQQGLQVLLTVDENSYQGGEDGDWHPVAWCREFDGGRSFYTGLGHTDESYGDPLFAAHILGGIKWCLTGPE